MFQTIPVTDPALFRSAAMPETSYHQRHIEASFYHTSVCLVLICSDSVFLGMFASLSLVSCLGWCWFGLVLG